MNVKFFLGIVLIGCTTWLFSGCGFNSQQRDKKETSTENVISEELHQAHCDLLAKANESMAEINQKVRSLNDVIREKKVKFTDQQNQALDSFDEKQASINKRMYEIKNVKQEEWELFKTTFENDLEEINTIIDDLLKEL